MIEGEKLAALRSEWDETANICAFEDAPNKLAGTYYWRCARGPDHAYEATLAARLRGRGCPFCAGKRASVTNRLVTLFPKEAAEVHPTRNGEIVLNEITARSSRMLWWKCNRGPDHEWTSKVCDRTKGQGCPACAGKQASVTNSVQSLSPELVLEWHETRNGALTPADIVAGSQKKVWWRCQRDTRHEWDASPSHRRDGGTGCPYCAGKRVDATNSLAECEPTYAAQWHPMLNGGLMSDQVVPGSGMKVWWKCAVVPAHEWQERVIQRVRLKLGCPYCSGRRLSPTNSLAFREPALAAEWHPKRNGALTPELVQSSSPRNVWWKCPEGEDHEWQTSPNQRTRKNRPNGCPFCRGYFVSVTNSVATLFPALVDEWHPRNEKKPTEVVAGSHEKVWWRCSEDPTHEWRAMAKTRTYKGNGCPVCANQVVTPTNSLAAVAPDITRQWHPEKNGSLTPADVVATSNAKVWWRCPSMPKHEWRATLRRRVVERTGCPDCMPVRHSRTELELAFELRQFLEFDVERHKLRLNGSGKRLDVDILVEPYRLIIEFDGAFWHARRTEQDRKKTRTLIEAGWTVIRVREAPLEPIGPLDVVVAFPADRPTFVKRCADATLKRIVEFAEVKLSGLGDYLAKPGPVASADAEEYFIALMARTTSASGESARES